MNNRYAEKCVLCGQTVRVMSGYLTKVHGVWKVIHPNCLDNCVHLGLDLKSKGKKYMDSISPSKVSIPERKPPDSVDVKNIPCGTFFECEWLGSLQIFFKVKDDLLVSYVRDEGFTRLYNLPDFYVGVSKYRVLDINLTYRD